MTKPTILKVTNAMKKPLTKLSVISAVSKVLTRTALTTAARITPMTDITELAQSLKAAAIDAKELAIIARYSKGRAAAEKFYALANPNNVIALVEALEKAQRANAAQDDHINQQQDRIEQLEKGHQEAAKQINSWRRMAKQNIAEREKDMAELDAARQRIAELESRTVKLPAERFCPAEYAGSQLWSETEVWNQAISACNGALHTAGIKVEDE
ncbi:TPA: ead/Ea22-like family protein [Klebsiella pneumoniae]|uniref:ead/Ea22-like family protein n=1 Tax=Klebsiella pneumoniae TaxID=573 RepID=UPI00322067FC